MPSTSQNHTFDHDLVLPDPSQPVKLGTPLPPEIVKLEVFPSEFCPLNLIDRKGHPKLPISEKRMEEIDFFNLFVDEEIIDMLVDATNTNATCVRQRSCVGPNLQHQNSTIQRRWKPVTKTEMYRYLGIFIYMGLHHEHQIKTYWNCDVESGPHHLAVVRAMSLNRWQQIHRYLHVCNSEEELNNIDHKSIKNRQKRVLRPHEKVEPVAKRLRSNFQQYWEPGTHVAVDECVVGFQGRSSDIVNIPSKPTPIGYKIWVLAEEGYVIDFLFHRRGTKAEQGPQGLSRELSRLKIPPTQQVVLELMSRMLDKGKNHCVWLDNLFTSEKLLQELRHRGIGGAGTVRLSQTKREEAWEKMGTDIQDLPGNPMVTLEEENPTATVQSLPSSLEDVEAMSDEEEEIRATPSHPIESQISSTSTTSQRHNSTKSNANKKPKPAANGLHPSLIELKKRYNKTLDWGRFFAVTSDDGKVLQFAWRDGSVVLFMSTVDTATKEVLRLRKRPSTLSRQIREVFGDKVLKELPIPGLIDMYNHQMNAVDLADQRRTSYAFQHRTSRTWVPLWRYLFETALSNAAKAWLESGHGNTKRSGHYHFRQACANSLMTFGTDKRPLPPKMRASLSNSITEERLHAQQVTQTSDTSQNQCGGVHKVLSTNHKACVICLKNSRTAAFRSERTPLSELSNNSVRIRDGIKSKRVRAPRTRYGCSNCLISICNNQKCWNSHVS
jgi:hypothetical protein